MRVASIGVLTAALVQACPVLAAPAFGDVADVASPRGETTRILIEEGTDPWVTVVLFAGGKGVLKIADDGTIRKLKGNFLIRSRDLFQAKGAVTAVIDGPSDQPKELYYFRSTKNHAVDVGAVIRHLRAKFKLPVWLVGTSRGTNSVANAAVRLQGTEAPDGIVLTATMTEGNANGDSVPPMALEKVHVPVLITHHEDDECSVTMPGSVGFLASRFVNAKPVKVMMYDGGSNPRGKVCGAKHYHGFIGIEDRVVGDIMAWIKAPQP